MQILHYSDHESKQFDQLYARCDVLISTGDLGLLDFPRGFLKRPDRRIAFGIYGNHCSGNYFEQLGIVNLHNKVVEYGGLRWGGFQGCLKYRESTLMYTEDQAREWSEQFPPVDVLLLHAGPAGMLDDPRDDVHRGSEHVRFYVLRAKPRLVLCGHQYSDSELTLGSTRVVRTYGARLITFSDREAFSHA